MEALTGLILIGNILLVAALVDVGCILVYESDGAVSSLLRASKEAFRSLKGGMCLDIHWRPGMNGMLM